MPGQAVHPPVHPRAELAQLPVGRGQHAAVHQHVPQVVHGPRAGQPSSASWVSGSVPAASCVSRSRMCGARSQSSVAAGLAVAAMASASGFSAATTEPVPSSSSRAVVQVTAHGSHSRLRTRWLPGAMPVSVPHPRQEKSRVIPAQSRQTRAPSRRPGSTRSAAPQPGQVPAADSAAFRHG